MRREIHGGTRHNKAEGACARPVQPTTKCLESLREQLVSTSIIFIRIFFLGKISANFKLASQSVWNTRVCSKNRNESKDIFLRENNRRIYFYLFIELDFCIEILGSNRRELASACRYFYIRSRIERVPRILLPSYRENPQFTILPACVNAKNCETKRVVRLNKFPSKVKAKKKFWFERKENFRVTSWLKTETLFPLPSSSNRKTYPWNTYNTRNGK